MVGAVICIIIALIMGYSIGHSDGYQQEEIGADPQVNITVYDTSPVNEVHVFMISNAYRGHFYYILVW